jgi:hypothetical protein
VVGFRFSNEGDEFHEMAIFRVKGDKPLAELSEEEAAERVVFVGLASAAPGESDAMFVRLKKPGRYAMVCSVPIGATTEEEAERAEGPPHYTEGMLEEFRVKKR